MPNTYYWEKLTFLKLVGKLNFSFSFEEQKVTSRETFILELLSSAVFRLQNGVSDFF